MGLTGTVRLKLLGGFSASLASGRAMELAGKKNRALLAYLALSRGKQHGREKLIALLWSDRGEAQARGSLRQALSTLKEALTESAPGALVLKGDSIGVEPEAVATDVAELEALAGSGSTGDLKRAAELYEGDLLDGLGVRDPGFEDWLSVERSRLRAVAIGVLDRLTASLAGAEAVAVGQRLVALDPLREASHRALMRAYAGAGEKALALQHYARCRDLLRAELGVAPASETEELRQRLLREEGTGPAPAERAAPKVLSGPQREDKSAGRIVIPEIADWLKTLGMSEYAERFAENGIDLSVLRHLTDQDLKDIGILLGHRRKMLTAIAELARTIPTASQPALAEARPEDVAERRQLTVLFCDLVGSTALASRLDPEDLREIIGVYHRCVADTVARFDGFVAKYMSDGVLVYFGYPQAHEDEAEQAVRAGLALVDVVGRLQAHEPLRVRVGIGSGPVVVGDLIIPGGGQERGAVGETPNFAAHLQALAEPSTVVIGPQTRRLLGDLFECRDLGAIEVKDLPEPVHAYQVVGESGIESRFEALHGAMLTPLVGREEEIGLLQRQWHRAKGGEGRVVLLSGEPGIGKSRLVAALDEWIENEPHTRMRYFSSPQRQDSALHPIIAQLERAAGFEREDTPEGKLDKLAVLTAASSEDVALLAELLSLPTEGRFRPLQLTPQRKKEKTFEALLRQLDALARRRPVLMLFEDVHWIDPSSRELLDLLVERVLRLPVLLLVTFRPEFQPPWTGQAHVTAVVLNRLDRRAGTELVQRVVGTETLPGDVVAEIVERSDGVPLFVEEMTKAVLEGGNAGTAFSRAGAAGPNVPATLHASLMARLDRLGPVAREVAQVGATLGREFSYELLAAVAQRNAAELDAALDQLVGAGLAFRRGALLQATYYFKHTLVQDAAYGTLLRSKRQELHGRVAYVLEEQWPETAETQPELLAHHCVQAGLVERAIAYYAQAGQRAIVRSAMAEAIAQLKKGLELLIGVPDSVSRQRQELELQISLGRALTMALGYAAPAVGETYTRARTLCEKLGRPPEIMPVLYGQYVYHLLRGPLFLARALAADFLKQGEDGADIGMTGMGHRLSGLPCFYFGEFVASRAHLEQALSRIDPAHRALSFFLNDPLIPLLNYLSFDLFCLGYFDQARFRSESAIEEASKVDRPFALVTALSGACKVDWATRSREELLARTDALIAVADEHGFPWYRSGTVYRGWALVGSGQTEEGIALLRTGVAAFRATGAVTEMPSFLTLLADAEGLAKQRDEGLEHLAEAERLMAETEERWAEAELHRVRGELLRAGRDPTGAERSFSQAIDIARQQSAKFWELRAAISLAGLWREQGKRDAARDLLASTYGWFTEGFDTPILKEAKALLDTLAS
jgi:class 3 adenylate cyclase/DNA-binding SARP family transcriptional activator/predicted ATPase